MRAGRTVRAAAVAVAVVVAAGVLLGPARLTSAADAGDPDALALARTAARASARARELAPGAVLHQVDVDPTDPASGWRLFFVTDAAASVEIDVRVPAAPATRWTVSRPPAAASKLVGHPRPGMDLRALRTGPAAAQRATTARWPGCTPRSLTLVGPAGDLRWSTACALPDGRVASETVDGRTGALRPSLGPPARPPPTATAR